jgi:uncharacterized protein (TIGR02808 family)
MSTIESIIWHILGYSAIPFIFIAGITISTLIFFLLLKLTGRGGDK